MAIFARKVNSYDLYSGHAWYTPGVAGMLCILCFFVFGAFLAGILEIAAMFLLKSFLSPEQIQSIIQNYGMIVVYPLQFIPVMIFAAYMSRMNMTFAPGYVLDNRNCAPYSFGIMILITVVMTFASMFVFDLPNYWNMQLTNRSDILSQFYDILMELMKEMTGGPLWSSFLVVAIFAPIFEEWMCRGMVLRGLLTKMKPVWAIVVSALFFAVIHMNPWQALNAFLLGLVMGYVYYKTGSLILTMIIHFVNNGTAVVLSNIESLKDYDYWIDILGKQNYMIVFVVSCVVLAACLYAFSRIKLKYPWGNIDRIPAAYEEFNAQPPVNGPVI